MAHFMQNFVKSRNYSAQARQPTPPSECNMKFMMALFVCKRCFLTALTVAAAVHHWSVWLVTAWTGGMKPVVTSDVYQSSHMVETSTLSISEFCKIPNKSFCHVYLISCNPKKWLNCLWRRRVRRSGSCAMMVYEGWYEGMRVDMRVGTGSG